MKIQLLLHVKEEAIDYFNIFFQWWWSFYLSRKFHKNHIIQISNQGDIQHLMDISTKLAYSNRIWNLIIKIDKDYFPYQILAVLVLEVHSLSFFFLVWPNVKITLLLAGNLYLTHFGRGPENIIHLKWLTFPSHLSMELISSVCLNF